MVAQDVPGGVQTDDVEFGGHPFVGGHLGQPGHDHVAGSLSHVPIDPALVETAGTDIDVQIQTALSRECRLGGSPLPIAGRRTQLQRELDRLASGRTGGRQPSSATRGAGVHPGGPDQIGQTQQQIAAGDDAGRPIDRASPL